MGNKLRLTAGSGFRVEGAPETGIVANAVEMFVQEMTTRHGLAATDDDALFVVKVRAPEPTAHEDDQVFDIRSQDGVVEIGGTGERGILYGFCELLDEIDNDGTTVTVPLLTRRRGPDIRKRGVERHWAPSLSDPAELEQNLDLIRALARRRINALLWIDAWIHPGWYRWLDFRHFEPLRRPPDAERQTRRECLNRIIAEARAWGMEFYLSCTEFTVPQSLIERCPELFHTNAAGYPVLRLDQPRTWAFYEAKIREAMELFPGLAGIELWTGEAMDIHYCHAPGDDRTVGQKLLDLYRHTLTAMDTAGRPDARLICSTFTHHQDGERIYEDLCGQLPERCEGRMKSQVEDFYRFNSPTTLAGRISPGREWVEFDTGGEHRGDWVGWITAGLTFIQERMRHYRERGVDQFIVRIRGRELWPDIKTPPAQRPPVAGDTLALRGPVAVKHDAFCQNCWDMDMSLADIWRRTRPPGWPAEMLDFYLAAEEVADKTQYVNRCLINNNHATFLGSVEHCLAKWKNNDVYGNDACRERAWITEPTAANVDRIVAEKDAALAAVARMQATLTACMPHLPVSTHARLQRCLDYQAQMVRVFRWHTEMFYRYHVFLHTDDADRLATMMHAVERCEEEIRKLRAFDAEQADNAYSLVGNIRSLSWVRLCTSFSGPKGIVHNE